MPTAVIGEEIGSASTAGCRLLSGRRLTRLASQGSQAAFAEIFRRHHQALYVYAKSILGNDPDARDAVQTAMVKLLDSLPGERREIALKPWLYRIVHNEAITLIRSRKRVEATSTEEPAVNGEDTDLRLQTRELLEDLSRLPDRQRSAVVLRELSGLSHKEIALALGTSPAAAKQAVYEGRLALQQAAEGREMDCSTARKLISADDRRVLKGRMIRSHIRSCTQCHAFEAGIKQRRTRLAGLSPLPLLASREMLEGILGSGAGPTGGLGVLGVVGAAKALGGGAAAQLAATVVVAAGAGVALDSGVEAFKGSTESGTSSQTPGQMSADGPVEAGPGGNPGTSGAGPGSDDAVTADGRRENDRESPAKGNGEAGSAQGDAGGDGDAPGSGETTGNNGKAGSPPGLEHAKGKKPDSPGGSGDHSNGKEPPGIGKPPGVPAKPPKPPKPPKPEPPKPPAPPVTKPDPPGNGGGKGG